jgi:hypothetical protein
MCPPGLESGVEKLVGFPNLAAYVSRSALGQKYIAYLRKSSCIGRIRLGVIRRNPLGGFGL